MKADEFFDRFEPPRRGLVMRTLCTIGRALECVLAFVFALAYVILGGRR